MSSEIVEKNDLNSVKEENSQEMSILLQKVLGTESVPEFTREQVDEVLSQKREVTNFIHEDKKRESKNNRFYLGFILVFILLFAGMVLFKDPEYFDIVLGFLAGIFGGGIGGYGLGLRKS